MQCAADAMILFQQNLISSIHFTFFTLFAGIESRLKGALVRTEEAVFVCVYTAKIPIDRLLFLVLMCIARYRYIPFFVHSNFVVVRCFVMFMTSARTR